MAQVAFAIVLNMSRRMGMEMCLTQRFVLLACSLVASLFYCCDWRGEPRVCTEMKEQMFSH
jgi:hypothetical protein